MRPETVGGVLLIAAIMAGCAAVEIDEEEPQDDITVQAQMTVKTALLDDGSVSAAPVIVVYEEGIVLLQGFVETEEERQRVGDVARRAVPGVEVVNDILVWKPEDDRGASGERVGRGES